MLEKFKRGMMLTIFCIIGMLFIAPSQTFAQDPPPCQPDCFSDFFGPLMIAGPYTLSCGESVIIKYRTRKACGTWDDVYIEAIEFVGGYTAASNCGLTMSIKDILAEATQLLLVNNPMGFAPTLPGQPCNSNWRVMTGGCWRGSFPTITASKASEGKDKQDQVLTPLGKLWPCDYNTCCLKMFMVCIDRDGNRVVTELPGGTPGECAPSPYPDCTPVCGDVR